MNPTTTPSTTTRQRIKDVFARQLATGGYAAASYDLIAQEIGIKKPSIYHHFPEGKQALLVEVGTDYIATQHAKIMAAMEVAGDLTARLTALAVAAVDPTGVLAGFDDRLFDSLSHVDDETRDRISRMYVTQLLDPVEALFRAEVTGGELVDSPLDAALLTNAFLHLARAITFRPDDASVPGDLVRLFLDGARPRR